MVVSARPLALIGMMGAGKTAVARLLGERLGAEVADLDALLEAAEGRSVADLFERDGEGAFRRMEGEILQAAVEGRAGVIACGGGIVLDPRHRALLRSRCRVVWLEVEPGEAARRVGADPAARPLLGGRDIARQLESLLRVRAPLYASVAELCVVTDGRTPEEVAAEILAALPGSQG